MEISSWKIGNGKILINDRTGVSTEEQVLNSLLKLVSQEKISFSKKKGVEILGKINHMEFD